MSTLKNKIVNHPSSDPIDRMIFERGLRIKKVWFDKETDLIILLLNNRKILKRPISDFENLAAVSENELNNFKTDGIGIHWPDLDEDLSLRGFLKYELLQMDAPVLVK